MMYKIIHIFILSLMAGGAFSQDQGFTKVRFAIIGGVNFQTMTGKTFFGDTPETGLITAFHAGINAQIPLVPQFYFQPGLLFSIKGAQIKENPLTANYKISYIEIPLNLVYKGKLGTGFVLLGFGPYVAYGIKGSAVYTATAGDITSPVQFKNIINADEPLTNTYFKPLDFGGNIFAGYEMASGVFLQLDTQIGMVNISPEDNRIPGGKTNLKNIGFGISAGYRF